MPPIQILVLASHHFLSGFTAEALSKLVLAGLLGVGFGVLTVYVSEKLGVSDRDTDCFDASDAIIGGIEPKKASRKLTLWELGSVSNTLTVESINLIKTEEKIKQQSLNFLSLWEFTQALNSLAQDFENLSRKVDKVWVKLSQADRDELRKIAYELANEDSIEKSTVESRLSKLVKVLFREPVKFIAALNQAISLARRDLKRLSKVASEYSAAKSRLQEARYQFIDTILNAVECDDPQYQQFLSDTLKELSPVEESNFDSLRGEVIKPGETREWLRSLSNKGFGKV